MWIRKPKDSQILKKGGNSDINDDSKRWQIRNPQTLIPLTETLIQQYMDQCPLWEIRKQEPVHCRLA